MKIREELGVYFPQRPKRPRKSKEVSESAPSVQGASCASDNTNTVASASTEHQPEVTSSQNEQGDEHF